MNEFIKYRFFDSVDNSDYINNKTLAKDCSAKFNTKNGFVFILSSGGASNEEKKISQMAIESTKTFFNAAFYSTPQEALKKGFAFVNQQINFTAIPNQRLAKKGISAIMFLMRDNLLYYAYSGDAWIYVKRQDSFSLLTSNLALVQTSLDEIVPNFSDKPLGLDPLLLNVFVCVQPILPFNDEIYLIGTGFEFQRIAEKDINNILSRKNTLKEKGDLLVERVSDSVSKDTSFQMIQFKNLGLNTKVPKGFDEFIIEVINFMTSRSGMLSVLVLIAIGGAYILGRVMKECPNVVQPTVVKVDNSYKKTGYDKDTTITYTLTKSEKLTDIAKRFNVNAEKLMEQNSKQTNLLTAGEQINIKIKAIYTYTKQKSLDEIALYYDTPLAAILKANNITDTALINKNEQLFIPLNK